jgi:PAS domain S-box-containing protein
VLSPPLSDPRALARELAARHAFRIYAAVLAVAAVTNAWMSWHEPWPRMVPALAYALGAATCLWASRLQGERADRALMLAGIVGVALVAMTAWIYGWGLNGLGLGFYALVTLAYAAFFSVRAGVAMAGLCIGVVLLLGWAEHRGWIAGVPALSTTLLARRAITISLLVLTGLAIGLLIVRLIGHWLQIARERERRFLTLLGIATDCYWEMNADHVVTEVWRRDAQGEFRSLPQPMQRPWDEPGMTYDDGALERHRADLDARRPFRDLHVRFRFDDGRVRDELVSGTPRFDAERRFVGYWGVARDVTAEYGARDNLRRATDSAHEAQALLQQLIQTSPNVLSLSDADTGRFMMVSAMFEQTLGYSREQVIGRRSGELGIWKNPEDRDRMMADLAREGRVQDMTFEFRARDGRCVALSCSASVSTSRGQRVLVMIGRDLTAQERERREREAILENASIGIALTRDRRFVMVNRRFEALYGWPPGGLIGQSGAVVWNDDDEYAEIGRHYGPMLARGEQIELERRMPRKGDGTFVARLVAKAVDPQRPVEGGTIWIVDDVTERRDVERALAQARDAAEAANRAKSAFLANTSHEIRTPLNGLLGLTRLARQGGIAEAQRQVYLAQIADSAENLAAIISDILDLSKIEAGKLEIESSEFDLHELLQSMHRAYAALSQPRGLTLTLHIDASVPNRVRGDAMRLRQILGNYLTNALKFTEKGGLTLNARAGSGDRLRFEVGDTGPGIDLATQARLFQPFTQADDSITRRFGGTGLGLSICRELAQLMGGEVGLESRLGVGSTFFVELPFPAVAPSPQISPTLEPDSAAALAGTHMLLVEDHPVNMMVAQAMLEQWGVRVEVATDGQAALDAVAQATRRGDDFDAVLMDVQMPGMSGYEATQILRRQYAADALPVIALTAAALVSEREQALSYGMNDFLTKPIDGARLHAALVRCLRRGRR